MITVDAQDQELCQAFLESKKVSAAAVSNSGGSGTEQKKRKVQTAFWCGKGVGDDNCPLFIFPMQAEGPRPTASLEAMKGFPKCQMKSEEFSKIEHETSLTVVGEMVEKVAEGKSFKCRPTEEELHDVTLK